MKAFIFFFDFLKIYDRINIVSKGEFFNMKKQYLSLKNILLLLGMGISLNGCQKETNEVENLVINEVESKEPVLNKNLASDTINQMLEEAKKLVPEIEVKDITISAIGDCTLGTDTHFGYENSFTNVLDNNNRDFSYFFKGVYDVLSKDDLTIANLETPFTDASEEYRVEKTFNFKGDAEYTNILSDGSIEVVNLANNHTYDYGEKGYNDTINILENTSIPYFGYENYSILEVEDMKIGLAGFTGWNEDVTKENTEKAIEYFQNNNADLIIMTYHWGIEREYKQNEIQESIARHAIDSGADLVLGHHPHVLQGIESYNGKYIVYSLGNFVFGGNRNPNDKDTMIFQETFHYENGVLKDTSIKIIPCSLSSRTDLNDYQPKILDGEEHKRVLKKVLDSSTNLEYTE